jgi:hypothetical protein
VDGLVSWHAAHPASNAERGPRAVLLHVEHAIGVGCRIYWIPSHFAVGHAVARPGPGNGKVIDAGSGGLGVRVDLDAVLFDNCLVLD